MSHLLVSDAETRCNTRLTIYPDGTTGACVVASHNIYRRPGWAPRTAADALPRLSGADWVDAIHDRPVAALKQRDKGNNLKATGRATPAAHAANVERGRRRAERTIKDYIRANPELDTFITLTISKEKLERYDYKTAQKKIGQWLANQSRRHGLKYVGVWERHKDGALHLHLICNRSALRLSPARNPRTGKLLKHRDKANHWHQIYNVIGWPYGYSTAMRCYGQRQAIAAYISKYVRKGAVRVGGRWYIHSHSLRRPSYAYYQCDYTAVRARYTQRIERPGAADLYLKYTSPAEAAAHILPFEQMFARTPNEKDIKKVLDSRRALRNSPCDATRASARAPQIATSAEPVPLNDARCAGAKAG